MAKGAGGKLKGTVSDLHANETNNVNLFATIHNPGRPPSVHGNRTIPGGSGNRTLPGGPSRPPTPNLDDRQQGWTDANGRYHTGSGRPVYPPTTLPGYKPPPGWANPTGRPDPAGA